MKWIAVAILGCSVAVAQVPTPLLSTADRIAIQACESSKQNAQQSYSKAEQDELSILREWSIAHPGYHINQQTFAVEADPKPEVPKDTPKPAEPKKL